jgi:plasmid stabilization system protein ParE
VGGNKLTFHPEAAEELEATTAWYAKRSVAAAAQFVAEVEHALEQVVSSPARWPRYGRARRYVMRRYPFSVVYWEMETGVEVLAVVHAKRRPGFWQGRQ